MGRCESVYEAVPWFWSDQRDLKLQIVGLAEGCDRWVHRDGGIANTLIFLGFRNGHLAAVVSVKCQKDHILARRLMENGRNIALGELKAAGYELGRFSNLNLKETPVDGSATVAVGEA